MSSAEHQLPQPLEAKPEEDLIERLKQIVEELESMNLPGLSLGFLVTGSRYRLDTLFYKAVRDKEDESDTLLPQDEKDKIWKEMSATYDGLSPENLTETFRYQYDREQKEKKLNGPQFPDTNTPEYEHVHKLFSEISVLLKELQRRHPEDAARDYLPTRLRGKWL